MDPIPAVSGKPQEWTFARQLHDARRAGKHIDLRLVDPSGKAHSWALRHFPEPGRKAFAARTETHTKEYATTFSGKIPSGYGAGTVKLERVEPTEVPEANERHVRFNLYAGKVPEQFLLKRMGNRWMLSNVTPSRKTERWRKLLGSGREKMEEMPVASVAPAPGRIMQPKIDGANAYVVLEGGKPPKVFSYRDAKNKTGIIEHTHKFKDWWKPVPGDLKTTVLRAEVFARGPKGRVAPPQVTGGLLNASVLRSRQDQFRKGLTLDLRTFKPERFDGRSVAGLPYVQQLELLDRAAKRDSRFQPMPTATEPAEQRRMLDDILKGRSKLTSEGVILRDASGKVIRAKQRPDFDVFVRKVVPGKREGETGAFRYSLTPRGKIVGNIGTGFSQSLRRQMFRNPADYVGRAAKVTAQGQFPSGALRAPSFKGWHIEKGRV